ncbi:unnamed protein product [Oikopleura dioica]|uniref:Neurotransmitter-gated ion-channel ligand-binding domain-containing protein n=1 Tax=Oikopleura dioica TaxID=34765 RepID=E4XHW5_OIKDI|nr:unnamed protein product [Oikopleura dioica]
MDYRITFFLRMKWNDERLRFKELGSPVTMLTVSPEVLHNIWKPDIFFSNEKQANFHSITAENKLLRIDHEGDVYVSMRLSATLACHMRLERFPMDVQVCNIQIESFGYDMNDLYFTWSSLAAVELSNRIELPQFVLKGYRTANCMKIYDTGNFTCIEARFILARQMGYYMIECFIPSALIVILSWVSFWISIDAVPARVSLGITTVLTITSQRASISSSLPKVSYIKALDIWMVICIAYVFAAVLEYACANFISRQHKGILEVSRSPYFLRTARYMPTFCNR